MNADVKPKGITVVLADDHPLLLAGFTISLAKYGIHVVGQAETPDEAIAEYLKLKPDVLVLDIRFGEKLSGLDAAKDLLARDSQAKIVFLSQFDQDTLIKEAYRLGGYAFVTKDRRAAELAEAIKSGAEGKRYYLPQVAERLANIAVSGDMSPQNQLEEREFEIFTLLAQGLTNVEIAEKLNLSTKTISIISQSLKEKLGVHRPADLTKLAVKHGLIEL